MPIIVPSSHTGIGAWVNSKMYTISILYNIITVVQVKCDYFSNDNTNKLHTYIRSWKRKGEASNTLVCCVFCMGFYLEELHVFGAVPVRKKYEIRGIHRISRSSLGTFILCAGTHWSN